MNKLQSSTLMTVLLFFFNGTANRVSAQKPFKNDVLYEHTDTPSTDTNARKASAVTLRGDVNHDNQVTIADVTALVDIILSGTATGGGFDPVADVNGDGLVTIADVTKLVDIILGKVPPEVPFDPGDGTGEALGKKR